MLTIRLIRTGKKNKSNFRVILAEKTVSPKSGKFLELLGNYNPHQKEISFKKERIKYWISKGAKASDTVHNLLVREGVIKGPKIKKKIKIKKKKAAEEPKEKAPAQDQVSDSKDVEQKIDSVKKNGVDKSEKKEYNKED
jgi:small subunit ribosomal protein S16